MNHTFHKRRGRRASSAASAAEFLDALSARAGRAGQARLARLWQNWSMVMGPELAALALPLGHRGGTLLVGGEDPMAIQDLSLLGAEMLERANAFMEHQFFREVKVGPCLGKQPLDALGAAPGPALCTLEPGPGASGRYLEAMNPDSPVAKCYALFVKKGK